MDASAEMGRDSIRYFLFLKRRWRWRPTKAMRAKGFRLITFGAEATPQDRARAIALNDQWDKVRRGVTDSTEPDVPSLVEAVYPEGSIGRGYQRAMKLRAAERITAGKTWSKDQQKRDDWPRAFKWIKKFGLDLCDPRTVMPEHFLSTNDAGEARGFLPEIEKAVSTTERHRFVKIWRALWKKMSVMGYCDRAEDPSLTFANAAPDGRQETWAHREVLKLVQRAWRRDKKGLAAIIAIAWDTMLSPIDVRGLTAGQMKRDATGALFRLPRAKTGRAAAGTLSRWSDAVLRGYFAWLKVEPLDNVPLFRTAGAVPGPKGGRRWTPQPYTKDRMEKDFAEIRAEVFGKDEMRQLADMRRSGHVEGDAGGAAPQDASSKMANTISVSNRLRKIYNPVNVPAVRRFDEARAVGRKKLEAGKDSR